MPHTLHWPLHQHARLLVHIAKQAKHLALPLFHILLSNCAQSTTHMAATAETMPGRNYYSPNNAHSSSTCHY